MSKTWQNWSAGREARRLELPNGMASWRTGARALVGLVAHHPTSNPVLRPETD